MLDDRSSPDDGHSVGEARHWIHGFILQTIVYGINSVLFLMCVWVLGIHIIKGSCTNRFHKRHLLQNCILLAYVIGMFALSSIFMGHQGITVGNAWTRFLQGGSNPSSIIEQLFRERAPLQKVCGVIFVLVNWGTIGILVSIPRGSILDSTLTLKPSYGGVCFIGK